MPSREQLHWKHIEQDRLRRAIRKDGAPNCRPERVRRHDWHDVAADDLDAWDDLDVEQVERVVPRGEVEKRRANLARAKTALADGLETPASTSDDTGTDLDGPLSHSSAELVATESARRHHAKELWVPPNGTGTHRSDSAVPPAARSDQVHSFEPGNGLGLVLEVSTGLCRVDVGTEMLLCSVRKELKVEQTGLTNVVAAGDVVRVTAAGAGRGVVEAVLPRQGVLVRPDVFASHLRQVVAANVDQILIVAAWQDPPFWPELVDRYLITAARFGLTPVICVNKIDLALNDVEASEELRPYTELGYVVVYASAVTGEGVDELRAALRGYTTVLAGLSGVGKSSLLRVVEPGLNLRIGGISEHWHQGRHTTTQAALLRLASGGYVIDTPGIREFGLAGLAQHQLSGWYPEMAALAGRCRFADCAHLEEPGCAVRAAVRYGRIAAIRYANYRKIYTSL